MLRSWLDHLCRLSDAQTRSISAENPRGDKSGGAQARPGDDPSCAPAAQKLGRGWKVRPCLRDIVAGASVTLADVEGPGVVRHVWLTVTPERLGDLRLRVTYDDGPRPSVDVPLGAFFANGIDGLAGVRSVPVAVNPRGGMNSYWPMPFPGRLQIEVANEGDTTVPELFYQVTYDLGAVPDDAACLCAAWRSTRTTPQRPEHVILDGVDGGGHYVGTYLVWHQRSPGWWGEGEVKFFIDGDPDDAPTICGTGTEDYFGGAWGFAGEEPGDPGPVTYSGPFLGFPQTRTVTARRPAGTIATHGLYRWHVPDPVRFRDNLRVTVQALGWSDGGTYRPLEDEIESVAYWYQQL